MSAPATVERETPASVQEAAGMLRSSAEAGVAVRPLGGGTKAGWGNVVEPHVELCTRGLADIVEHNEGDLTAVLQTGVPLARAQAAFAEKGQMLALDPPLGADDAATVGGIVASGDTGPLRHRYGAGRDLVVGMRLALSDGTVARSGGKVIKNVAGYDLAKLMAGSFGTLGLILEVAVRLHPRPADLVTARADREDPDALARGVAAVAHSHLEPQCLDVAWSGGRGAVLARFGGATAAAQAEAAARILREGGVEATIVEDDEPLWAAQREGQRSADGVVVRVAGLQARAAEVVRVADRCGASLVGRGGLGTFWLKLERLDDDAAAAAVEDVRARLRPQPCVVLDAPEAVRRSLDVWGESDRGRLELARRVKQRFDPHGIMNPGLFVGGI